MNDPMSDAVLERLFAIGEIDADQLRNPVAWLSEGELAQWRSFGNQHAATCWLAGRWGMKSLLQWAVDSGQWAVDGIPVGFAVLGSLGIKSRFCLCTGRRPSLLSSPGQRPGESCRSFGATPYGLSNLADWRDLHIVSRDEEGKHIRPVAFFRDARLPCSLSLSHSDNFVYVAASPPHGSVGVDVVEFASVSPRALETWRTPDEKALCRSMTGKPEVFVFGLVWALKEAWFKAESRNEPFRPLQWNIAELLPDAPAVFASLFEFAGHEANAIEHSGRRMFFSWRKEALGVLVSTDCLFDRSK
jgi:phosphopantetheinyl transferase (holo-ACP synthase)